MTKCISPCLPSPRLHPRSHPRPSPAELHLEASSAALTAGRSVGSALRLGGSRNAQAPAPVPSAGAVCCSPLGASPHPTGPLPPRRAPPSGPSSRVSSPGQPPDLPPGNCSSGAGSVMLGPEGGQGFVITPVRPGPGKAGKRPELWSCANLGLSPVSPPPSWETRSRQPLSLSLTCLCPHGHSPFEVREEFKTQL